jgi:transcriptional regulator with XRE-family HTH domain
MQLRTYLDTHQIPVSRFATTIGASEAVVYRYLSGERFPRPAVLQRIAEATGGKVQPNDFHAFAAGTTCPCAAGASA